MSKSNKPYSQPTLLRTESKQEWSELVRELMEEIQPQSRIEREYVNDIAHLMWEIMRYRRFKATMINNGFRHALKTTLRSIFMISHFLPGIEAADELTEQWFFDQKAKERVSGLLEEAGLDEMAIEAEALALRFTEIEKIDRSLASAEVRRDKALRALGLYQESFARKVQQSTERLLTADTPPGISPSSSMN